MAGGRPPKFSKELIQKAKEYSFDPRPQFEDEDEDDE